LVCLTCVCAVSLGQDKEKSIAKENDEGSNVNLIEIVDRSASPLVFYRCELAVPIAKLRKTSLLKNNALSIPAAKAIDLTMNTYTDPAILDVHGAMNSLPSLDAVEDSAIQTPGELKATGTEDSKVVVQKQVEEQKLEVRLAPNGTYFRFHVASLLQNICDQVSDKAPAVGSLTKFSPCFL